MHNDVSPVRSTFTELTSICSGSNFVKSMSHCASSRFNRRIRFWAAIFSFANRSISCSNSRSFRFRNWSFKHLLLKEFKKRDEETYLNVSDCSSQDGQVGCFLLVGRYRQLLFKRLETFLQVRTSIFLQLVVHFTCASSNGRRTSQRATVEINFQLGFYKKLIWTYLLLFELIVRRLPLDKDGGIGKALKVDWIGVDIRWSSSDMLLSISRSSPLQPLWFKLGVVLLLK